MKNHKTQLSTSRNTAVSHNTISSVRTKISTFHIRKTTSSNTIVSRPGQQSTRLAFLNPRPSVNSTCWLIHDCHSKNTIAHRSYVEKQVASLTKIMTCLLVLQLAHKFKLKPNLLIRISKSATLVQGTSAQLLPNYWITLQDLLYALMLPSGNDAAVTLAQTFGLLMFYYKTLIDEQEMDEVESVDVSCYDNTNQFINQFIKQMNRRAQQLHLSSTSFMNPHGLSQNNHFSCARDLLSLTLQSHRNQQFSKIVATAKYTGSLYLDQHDDQPITIQWQNTNKLLQNGWQGTKTGQTPNAGGCLISLKEGILIIVLNTNSRFQDTLALWQWYYGQTKKSNI